MLVFPPSLAGLGHHKLFVFPARSRNMTVEVLQLGLNIPLIICSRLDPELIFRLNKLCLGDNVIYFIPWGSVRQHFRCFLLSRLCEDGHDAVRAASRCQSSRQGRHYSSHLCCSSLVRWEGPRNRFATGWVDAPYTECDSMGLSIQAFMVCK